MPPQPTVDQSLRAENAELRARLEEAEETLRAIRAGEVDGLMVEGDPGLRLQGAEAEQNRLRGAMLAQVSDAVVTTDGKDRITFLNAAAEQQYRVRLTEELGRKVTELFTRHWASPKAEAAAWAALEERGHWCGEMFHRTRDGRELPVEASIAILRDPRTGERSGLIDAIRDIAERKQVEQETAESLRLLDTLLTHAPVGFVFLDRDLRFVRINERLAEINGLAIAAHLGRTVAEILPTLEPTLREVTARILATGQPVLDHEFSGETARAPGVVRYWSESWYPVRCARGEIMGFGGVVVEVTQRKEAEAALRLSNERFELAVKCSRATLSQQDLELRFTWLHNLVAGIDCSDAVGKRDDDLLERAEDAAVILALKREVIRSGVGLRRETSPQIKGVVHYFDVLLEPLRDAAGIITGVTGAALDITTLKCAEQARYEMERNYRALAVASYEIAYRMSADWSTMLPLDGRQLVPSSDRPLTNWAWLDQNLPRDEHSRVRQAIGEAIAKKTLFELEHRVRRPDGSTGWTLSRAVPILDENEEVIAWFGAASDITERKAAEATLRDNEERMRLATEATEVGIWEWNVVSGFIRWDAQMFRLYGVTPTADGLVSYETWRRAVLPQDVARQEEVLRDTVRGLGHSTRNFRILRADDGECRWIQAVETVRANEEGKAEWVLGTNLDVTEEENSRRQLAEANEQLASHAKQLESLVERRTAKLTEAIGELEGFAYSITHDLRAPLRAVNSFSHMLAADYADKLDEDGKRLLGRISQSVTRMDNLIQDVLQYSKVLRTDLKLEPVNADRLVRGMLDSYPAFQEPHANIVIEGQLPEVLANEAALTQCFSNLLNNAVKFVPAGAKPRVSIRAEAVDSTVRFLVKDNGIGIEPKYLENIFGLFHRLSNDYEGTGVGLSIVRKAVERMGGKAGAESEPGQGSRFWFELQRVDPERKRA